VKTLGKARGGAKIKVIAAACHQKQRLAELRLT